MNGVAQPNLSASSVKQFEIPLPPLEEQKRIAGILNKADELKKLREEADKKTEELIPAIFHEMVGSRIKKGEELPAGWRWVKLGMFVNSLMAKPFAQLTGQQLDIPLSGFKTLIILMPISIIGMVLWKNRLLFNLKTYY